MSCIFQQLHLPVQALAQLVQVQLLALLLLLLPAYIHHQHPNIRLFECSQGLAPLLFPQLSSLINPCCGRGSRLPCNCQPLLACG